MLFCDNFLRFLIFVFFFLQVILNDILYNFSRFYNVLEAGYPHFSFLFWSCIELHNPWVSFEKKWIAKCFTIDAVLHLIFHSKLRHVNSDNVSEGNDITLFYHHYSVTKVKDIEPFQVSFLENAFVSNFFFHLPLHRYAIKLRIIKWLILILN